MKGVYILFIELKNNQIIQIGKLGKLFFKKGNYVYIGSSMNNLEKRINRHLNKYKKFHWHIDYFLEKAEILKVYIKETTNKEECKLANIFKEKLEKIPYFGCSDCKCESHLFYGSYNIIYSVIIRTNIKKYLR